MANEAASGGSSSSSVDDKIKALLSGDNIAKTATEMYTTITQALGSKEDQRVGVQIDQKTLRSLTPFTGGRGVLIPIKSAKFMDKVFSEQTKAIMYYLQVGLTGIDGFSNSTIDSGEVTLGGNRHLPVPIARSGYTNEITMKLGNVKLGLPVVRYLKTYMDGMIDPISQNCHMYGATDGSGNLLEPTIDNLTWDFIYFTVGPSFREIQQCHLIHGAWVSQGFEDLSNFESKQHEVKELSVTWACHIESGHPDIRALCKTYLDTLKLDNKSISQLRSLIGDTSSTTTTTTP